jgi:hypothetical protein
MQWIIGITIGLHVVFGAWSANRAWVQVRSLDVDIPIGALRAGWTPRISVVTSGRTSATVYVTIVQDGRADTISVHSIGGHRDGFWDPRFISRTFSPRVSARQAERLTAGRAILRAEAHGRPQWLRTPPPVVREVPVIVASRS